MKLTGWAVPKLGTRKRSCNTSLIECRRAYQKLDVSTIRALIYDTAYLRVFIHGTKYLRLFACNTYYLTAVATKLIILGSILTTLLMLELLHVIIFDMIRVH